MGKSRGYELSGPTRPVSGVCVDPHPRMGAERLHANMGTFQLQNEPKLRKQSYVQDVLVPVPPKTTPRPSGHSLAQVGGRRA